VILRKLCRHAKGLTGDARRRAWSRCGCAWVAGISIDGHRRYFNLGPDQREAKMKAARLVADRAEGKITRAAPGASVAEVAQRWYERALRDGARPQTLVTYEKRNRRIIEYFGPLSVRQVDAAIMVRFADRAKENLAATNAREHYRQLRAVLKLALEEGLITKVPDPRVRFARPIAERLTLPEAERLISALAQPYRDLGEFVLLTGLRIGEALGLEADDLAGRRLHIRRSVDSTTGVAGPPKTSTSGRSIVLSERALELLATRINGGRIWRVSYRAARGAMTKAQKDSGLRIRGRGWHELRHAHTRLLEEAGYSLRAQAQRLGHGNNLPQTMRYGGFERDHDANLLDAHRQTSGATATGSGGG
jgi:integrase